VSANELSRILQHRYSATANAVYRWWYDTVERYTRSYLTFSTDRPNAILGIVETIATFLGLRTSDYVFDFWKPRFVHNLLWLAAESDQCRCRLDVTVPSWSWLLVSVGVYCNAELSGKCQLLTDLVQVPVSFGGSPADSGCLLCGPMCQVALRRNSAQNQRDLDLDLVSQGLLLRGVFGETCDVILDDETLNEPQI
jgi:hypothetical protein